MTQCSRGEISFSIPEETAVHSSHSVSAQPRQNWLCTWSSVARFLLFKFSANWCVEWLLAGSQNLSSEPTFGPFCYTSDEVSANMDVYACRRKVECCVHGRLQSNRLFICLAWSQRPSRNCSARDSILRINWCDYIVFTVTVYKHWDWVCGTVIGKLIKGRTRVKSCTLGQMHQDLTLSSFLHILRNACALILAYSWHQSALSARLPATCQAQYRESQKPSMEFLARWAQLFLIWGMLL